MNPKQGPSGSSSSKRRRLNTEKVKRHREKIKGTEKHDERKKKDRERKQKARSKKRQLLKKNKDLLAEVRAKKAEEMRAYRQKQKAKTLCKSSDTDLTCPRSISMKAAHKVKHQRKQVQDRDRERYLQKKEIEIQKKKAVIRTQRWRLRLAMKPADLEMNDSQESPVTEECETPFKSKWTKNRAIQRAKKSLPQTPIKRASVVEKLASSPSCRAILEKKGAILSEENKRIFDMNERTISGLKTKIDEVKHIGGASKDQRVAYSSLKHAILGIKTKHGNKSALYKKLKIKNGGKKAKWWESLPRKARKDQLPAVVKDKVTAFYTDPETSRELPHKRDVTQKGLEKRIMVMTIQEAYKVFRQDNPRVRVGLTAFRKLKPANIARVSETSHRNCLCQICCKIALKSEALKKFVNNLPQSQELSKLITTSKREIAALTVCPHSPELYPKQECLTRQCPTCGGKKIREIYKDIIRGNEKKDIQWNTWGYLNVMKKERQTRVLSCLTKTTTLEEFISVYEKELDPFANHLFRSAWQHKQMNICIENMPINHAVLVMDYAENYACRYQNEAQSAFFDPQQVIVHPVMTYYRTSVEGEDGPEPILAKHSIIFITDDDKKDYTGVAAFEDHAFQILSKCVANLDCIHEWTDGCACQYKGKYAFMMLSQQPRRITRNYFETSHGKSVCDGLGATTKNCCSRAVLCGKTIIKNAEDFFSFCKANYEYHSKVMVKHGEKYLSSREYVFVSRSDVVRPSCEAQTLKGTRQLHSVRNTQTGGSLEVRKLSCYCRVCYSTTSDRATCLYQAHVENWATVQLKKTDSNSACPAGTSKATVASKSARHPRPKPETSSSTPQIECGDFVAVRFKKRTKNIIFMAEVLDADGDDCWVRFMKKQGGVYVWPEEDDLSLQAISSVIISVQPPTLVNTRGHFTFNEPDVNAIKEKSNNLQSVYFE